MNTGANLMDFANALMLSSVAAMLDWTVTIALGAVLAMLSALFILLACADRRVDQAN